MFHILVAVSLLILVVATYLNQIQCPETYDTTPVVVDCTNFENRKDAKCSCFNAENKENVWCMTQDELFSSKTCDGMCKERTGESRCSLHFRSSPTLKMYYCARLK
jgi:hypothetical protein